MLHIENFASEAFMDSKCSLCSTGWRYIRVCFHISFEYCDKIEQQKENVMDLTALPVFKFFRIFYSSNLTRHTHLRSIFQVINPHKITEDDTRTALLVESS